VEIGGRRVADLRNEYLGAGDHELVWDGRRDDGKPVRPGIYWVVVTALNETHSAALVVVE
jgi:hypothetical protein